MNDRRGLAVSHSYKDLIVWQESKSLASALYRATANFPKTECYGLTAQIRRAGVSVASNIAEGQGRLTRGEFLQFLGHARGSLLELQTQLEIAEDLSYLSNLEHRNLEDHCAQVLRLLNGLIDSLGNRAKAASG
jgi:four helix bundle protein